MISLCLVKPLEVYVSRTELFTIGSQITRGNRLYERLQKKILRASQDGSELSQGMNRMAIQEIGVGLLGQLTT